MKNRKSRLVKIVKKERNEIEKQKRREKHPSRAKTLRSYLNPDKK